jgi:type I restriction enzyme M protein
MAVTKTAKRALRQSANRKVVNDKRKKIMKEEVKATRSLIVNKNKKELDDFRKELVEQLRLANYSFRQIIWLQENFPKAELRDVEGLVKLVSRKEIEKNDWSLTPGRYVGVAPPPPEDEDEIAERLKEIHIELADLNKEATSLAKQIQKNFEELL